VIIEKLPDSMISKKIKIPEIEDSAYFTADIIANHRSRITSNIQDESVPSTQRTIDSRAIMTRME